MRVPSTQPLLRRPLSTLLTCAGGADAISLAGPILMRSIGALFNPANEPAYFTSQVFPNDFDLLIFVRQATQSTLLPFSF
jgi:hypothetical protein